MTVFSFRLFACALALLCLAFPDAALALGKKPKTYPVSMRTFGIWNEHTLERFDIAVWFPGRGADRFFAMEGWKVRASRGKIVPGFYPVILLSHDTASSRFANNDTARALAAHGFVVIVPTHAADNQADSSGMFSADLLHARPRQLLRALETVLEQPDLSPYLDESRIGVLGVGTGSLTVLQLAGLRPRAERLEPFCNNADQPDIFCHFWSGRRLAQLADGLASRASGTDPESLIPALDLYAPRLIPAPARPVPPEAHPSSLQEEADPPGFWQRLVRRSKTPALPENEQGRPLPAAPETDPPEVPEERYVLAIEFHQGPFRPPDDPVRFIHIDPPEVAPQMFQLEMRDSAALSPTPAFDGDIDASRQAYRRPPARRSVRAIGLVAPAGGMLFAAEDLQRSRLPVAIVQAGADEVYPGPVHAAPYREHLPRGRSVILEPADHYSLFAECSDEMADILIQGCGRIRGAERDRLAQQKNMFLVSFFLTALGGPATEPVEPLFIAAPAEEETKEAPAPLRR